MAEEGASEQVRKFIWDHISSVAQLEILLLLHTSPKQTWSSTAIAHELRIEPAGAKIELESLCTSSLVKVDSPGADVYQFAPQRPDLEAATALLAQAFLIRRVTVIGLIFSKPSDKMRSFSDAFRLRRGPPNG